MLGCQLNNPQQLMRVNNLNQHLMSNLQVNTRKLGELYEEWRGNKSSCDNGKPVFEADELLDFAEFCLKHEANETITSKRQSNIPHVNDWLLYDFPQNMPLYKDSGLWQLRSDDMEEVVLQQGVNESDNDFIKRCKACR
jgi:hypothetical protein